MSWSSPDKFERYRPLFLHPQKKCFRISDGQPILRGLREDADEPQLRDCASQDCVPVFSPEIQHPAGNALMKLVFEKAQCDQRVRSSRYLRGGLTEYPEPAR